MKGIQMRTMRWMAMGVVGMALLVPATLWAQAPGGQGAGQGQRPEGAQRPGPLMMVEHLRQLVDSLQLSDDQKSQVQTIFTQAMEDAKSLRAEFEGKDVAPQERQQRMGQLLQNLREKLGDVLTEEQKAQLREKLQAARGTATTRPAGTGPGGGMLERLKELASQLDLSEDQKSQIQTILSDARQQMQSLRAQGQQDRQAMREKVQQLMQQTRQKLLQVLTPEQQQKLRELIQQQGGGQGAGRPHPTSAPASNDAR